jgi:hypothetical protein
MTVPRVTNKKTVGLFILTVVLLASGITYLATRPAPTDKVPTSPPVVHRIEETKYGDLISREKNAAVAATRRAQVQYDASVKRRIALHASETASTADQAANRAAEFETLTKTIYYLAKDQVTGGKEADRLLQEHIGPIVEQGLQSLAKDVNADIASFDYEVRRITVQLATNIAAIGPGVQPAPPRVVTPAMIGPEFSAVVMGLGGKFTHLGVGVGLTAIPEAIPKTMVMKVSKMCAGIALRLFGKQVAKLASSAAIGTATGPFEIVVLIGSIIWTGYDVFHARTEYRDEVRTVIKKQLDHADHQIASGAVNYFSGRTADFLALQTAITTKALDDIQKKAPK